MNTDIFKFWSEIPKDACKHPADELVLQRTSPRFEPTCLPSAYDGPLKKAKVILLFLSPGFDSRDVAHGAGEAGKEFYARQRSGEGKLASLEEHPSAYEWIRKRLRQFGIKSDAEYEQARSTVAIFNIGAYKSQTFKDWPMLAALPSCRVALDWAQSELFPKAVSGKKVVVCMRSPKYWGLGGPTEGLLFCPPCTRGGFMKKGKLRDQIERVVREASLS